jgi:6-phosphogluconolactonase (cycloisomerase 2 family)
MMSKPSGLALSGMVLVCAAILAACNNSSPKVQFVTVAPKSGEIYVSAKPAGGVRGAAERGARPALQTPPQTGKRPEAIIPPVTATCGSLQYASTALYSDGSTKDVSSTATWSSSSTSVATISTTGLATGIALGTTNIGATFNGVSATSEPLLVDQLNSITLNPLTANVGIGASQPFVAIGNFTFAAGGSSALDVSSQVTWASTNKSVATIDSTGNATAVATGSTTITATSCDGITVGKATLTVGPPAATSLVITPATITISTGTTTLFTAMEKLSNGMTQPLAHPVTWSSGTTTVATIDPNSAVALGITAGTSTVTATETVSGLMGTATLTVQAAAARFAYVANGLGGNSGSISGYTVDVTAGTFAPLTGSPFSASLPQQVILHPSGDFMYYLDFNGSLHVEDIKSADGSLTDSGQAVVVASPTASANVGVIDPTGRFIYVISDAGNSIYGFSITQTGDKAPATNGALTAIPGMTKYTDATLNAPTWIMTDRTGKYVYVVNNLGNSVSEYAITQTGANAGALTPLGTTSIPTGIGPVYGTTDVNGHLYVANDGTTQSVSGYTIGSNGQLTSVGADFTVTGATATINVLTDPTGKYLYVLDADAGGNGQVFAYNLNTSTGVIGSQIGTAQPTQIGPFGLAIDPTGALLAIDNNVSNTISLFKVAAAGSTTPPSGGLTPANPPTAATDAAPLFVTFYTAASGQ